MHLLPFPILLLLLLAVVPQGVIAQVPPSSVLEAPTPPSLDPPAEPQPLPPLPPPEELLPTPDRPVEPPLPGDIPATIPVTRYEVLGSTVFSPEELEAATREFVGEVTFAQLLQARSAITQLYTDAGYITSGAFIPPQTLEGGVVRIQVIEGRLEAIEIEGTRRLQPGYVRSRLALAGASPLNVNELLEGLQLLQLDPLIASISAELEAGTRPGTSLLQVRVTEADSFRVDAIANNGRSPSVGSFRRGVQVSEGNVLGWGDGLSLTYLNTDGSNEWTVDYLLPVSPRNHTLRLSYGTTSSEVIEPEFEPLGIEAESRYYELTYRHLLHQSPSEELAIGITASRQESQTELGIGDLGPFPLSPGADEEGRTRVSALRFFQDWTRRSGTEVLAARSQFSIGLDALDATTNQDGPDSRFFAWRGQGQWVRLLAPDTLFLVRADLQLTEEPLLSLEQFGLGGQQTVRGYRQDTLLTDSGFLMSAEVRIPVLRVPSINGILQLTPFLDVGTGWNSESSNPDPSTLVGLGLGLLWRMDDRLTARLDWGWPLTQVDDSDRTWQENGIYFSINFTAF